MDIYAVEGYKVIVTAETIENGYSVHTKKAKKYLKIDGVYRVEYTKVDDWHTDVYLKEIPHIAFNSVHFKEYENESSK